MYSVSQLLALGVALAVCAAAVLYADWFAELFPARDARLSEAEQQQMLASMVFHASKNGLDGDAHSGSERAAPRVAFCCSADLDVAVPAVELMESVQETERLEFAQHHKKKPAGYRRGGKFQDALARRHHERIGSLRELQESFAFYFSSGAAAEQSMLSPEQFREVVALADALPGATRKVGGNAALMAERAAAEGCAVLLGAAIGREMAPLFSDRVQLVGHLAEHELEDVHLVLEYARGDAFRGHESPRANRYYLNHDVHNARLSVLEQFERELDAFRPDLVVFGGLQLLEVETDVRGRLARLAALSHVLQNLFLARTPSHYEFAAVSDFSLFDDTVRLVLPWVDSIGLNEQELFILHHYLVTGEEATATTSRPTVAHISAQLHDVIQFAAKAKAAFQAGHQDDEGREGDERQDVERTPETLALAQLSRIHFHTLQFHIVCQQDGGMWEDPTTALVQSALLSSKLACGKKPAADSSSGREADGPRDAFMRPSAEMEVDPERVELLLARHQLVSARQSLKVELDPFAPVVSWQEADFQCHLVPMLACKKPDHTAGLGDNISGTGMAYHRLQRNKAQA